MRLARGFSLAIALLGTHLGALGGEQFLLVGAYWERSVLKYDAETGAYLGEFIPSGYGDLSLPECMVLRPGGDFYIASVGYGGPHSVKRYDYNTGAFLGDFATGGGLDTPRGIVFGPDNNLYVASDYSHEVLRYNGRTGAFMDAFVTAHSGGLTHARDLLFWGDSLYVSSLGTDNILRYDASAGNFLGVFASSVHLDGPQGIALGPDGLLYVASGATDSIVRFNMQTGNFVDVFVPSNSGGLDNPNGLVFGVDGDLLVASHLTNNVLRYDGQSGTFVGVFASEGLAYPSYMLLVPVPGTARAGDTDLDGDVDFRDYQLLEAYYGESGAHVTWGMGDFDGDRDVDFADYQALESNFGTSVPEPAVLGLLGAGLGWALRRRKPRTA